MPCCRVCREGLEGMWDPNKTPRVGLLSNFLEERPTTQWELEQAAETAEVTDYVYGHHRTKTSFSNSMKEGCVTCNMFIILSNYYGSEDDSSEDDSSEGDSSEDDSSEDDSSEEDASSEIDGDIQKGFFSVFYMSPRVKYEWEDVVEGELEIQLRGHEIVAEDEGCSLIPVEDLKSDANMNFDISPSTGDAATWAVIEKWFTDCLQTHAHCRPGLGSATRPGYHLPTRLLEINDQSFRLVLGADCNPDERYMALSHCWGKKPPECQVRLTKATSDALRQYQLLSSLPKTFRDAMAITSRIGIRYLWIDRLCIYQDSPEDWRAEAASMQDVYKNSHLTISALSAADDEGGCFFERDPEKVAPSVVSIRRSRDQQPERFRFSLEKGLAWRLMFEHEPIVRRAWVIQERLLSPRVLHFGRKQVFWECRERNACEIHPATVYDDDCVADAGAHPHLWKQLFDSAGRDHADDPYEQLFEDWKSMLQQYVNCQLTVPGDKLVALSGVADDMQRRLKELQRGSTTYLAGLWEARLRDGLLWQVEYRGHRVKTYRAPSWSWASMDGHVSFPFEPLSIKTRRVSFITEISGETSLAGASETGAVTGGSLTLRGPVVHVQTIPNGMRSNVHAVKAFTHPRAKESYTLDVGKDAVLSTGQHFSRADIRFDDINEMPKEVLGIPLDANSYNILRRSWVLAVVPVEEKQDLYRRVGLIDARLKIKHEENVEAFFGKFPTMEMTIV